MSVAGATMSSSRVEERDDSRNWPLIAAASVVGVLAYGPLLWIFFRQQWEKPHYQYFPFVIAAFGWLLFDRWRHGTPRAVPYTKRRWWDAMLLSASVALLMASIYPLNSPWGAAVSLILLAAYLCRVLSRTREITYLWGIWSLLWLVVPLPLNLDQALITRLQGVSSRVSSFVLDLIGVVHVMEGNTLALPAKQLFVDEACSGIVSILSVVACALVYGVFKNRSPMHLLLLILAGVGWATVVNVIRISSIAAILQTWGVDWSAGTAHEVLSLALFMVTFLALLSTDQLLLVAAAPIRAAWHETHSQDISIGARLAAVWDAVVTWGQPDSEPPAEISSSANETTPAGPVRRMALGRLALVLVLPAVVQTALLGYAAKVAPERLAVLPYALEVDSADLPSTLCGLNKVEFAPHERPKGDLFGRYSKTYVFREPESNKSYTVSFDFPFPGRWHELTVCYTSNGWQPVEREIRRPPATAGSDGWEYVEADFEQPSGEQGALYFAEFDQFGDPIKPQPDWLETGDSFVGTRNLYLSDRHAFQVQVWLTRQGVVSKQEREKALELLLEVRKRFRDQITDPRRQAKLAQSPTDS